MQDGTEASLLKPLYVQLLSDCFAWLGWIEMRDYTVWRPALPYLVKERSVPFFSFSLIVFIASSFRGFMCPMISTVFAKTTSNFMCLSGGKKQRERS